MKNKNNKLYGDNYFEKLPYLRKRIDVLVKEKKFFEVSLWFSNIFESEITMILSFYERIIKLTDEICYKFLKEYNPRECEDIRKEKKTLGELKSELNRYLRDKDIMGLLENFIKTRNKIFHQFFETSEKPEIMEKEIESKIGNWWKLACKLSEEMNECLRNCNELFRARYQKLKNNQKVKN